jgi:hypothetical protein
MARCPVGHVVCARNGALLAGARGMTTISYHVVPHGERWAVKRSGASRASVVLDTKAEAVARGKRMAKRVRCEFVVHSGDGRVGNPNSYGNDSRKVRDRRR